MIFLLFLVATVSSQKDASIDAIKIPEELEYGEENEEKTEKDILVIPNRFPKDLNFFCYPRSGLQHDRMCFGQLDAYALACADDTPPIQLVPFCIAFKNQCSQVNYPSETFCKKEKRQYKRFCTRNKRQSCKSCHYDLSCSCEPYECIWRRFGFETARWCQRYELFCNQKIRREKASELVSLMHDAVKVHYKCFHMFNLAQVICDPFRRQFDQQRCMKFLFDCELISDFEEEPVKEETQEELLSEQTQKGHGNEKEKPSGSIFSSPEEAKQAKKLQEEEAELSKEIAEAEAKAKNQTTPFEKVRLPQEGKQLNGTNIDNNSKSKTTEPTVKETSSPPIKPFKEEDHKPPKNPFRILHS